MKNKKLNIGSIFVSKKSVCIMNIWYMISNILINLFIFHPPQYTHSISHVLNLHVYELPDIKIIIFQVTVRKKLQKLSCCPLLRWQILFSMWSVPFASKKVTVSFWNVDQKYVTGIMSLQVYWGKCHTSLHASKNLFHQGADNYVTAPQTTGINMTSLGCLKKLFKF